MLAEAPLDENPRERLREARVVVVVLRAPGGEALRDMNTPVTGQPFTCPMTLRALARLGD
jgi:hypothetical protein